MLGPCWTSEQAAWQGRAAPLAPECMPAGPPARGAAVAAFCRRHPPMHLPHSTHHPLPCCARRLHCPAGLPAGRRPASSSGTASARDTQVGGHVPHLHRPAHSTCTAAAAAPLHIRRVLRCRCAVLRAAACCAVLCRAVLCCAALCCASSASHATLPPGPGLPATVPAGNSEEFEALTGACFGWRLWCRQGSESTGSGLGAHDVRLAGAATTRPHQQTDAWASWPGRLSPPPSRRGGRGAV